MLWEKFHLIKSVVLAKMSQKLQIIIDVQTDERMKGPMDAKQFFYTKAVTVLLLNFTCLIFFSNQSFKNVMIQHTLYTCLDEHS